MTRMMLVFTAETEDALDCKNWGNKYKSAGLIGKAGIGFAAIAGAWWIIYRRN